MASLFTPKKGVVAKAGVPDYVDLIDNAFQSVWLSTILNLFIRNQSFANLFWQALRCLLAAVDPRFNSLRDVAFDRRGLQFACAWQASAELSLSRYSLLIAKFGYR